MSIYKEIIIDNYKHPMNFKEIKNPDFIGFAENSSCGDKIKFSIKLSGEIIDEVGFSGNGCAISIATASLLSEKIKGMSYKKIKDLNKEDILELLGIDLNPLRLKCALIPLESLKNATNR